MKKALSVFLSIVMALSVFSALSAFAQESDRPWKESETIKIIDHTVYELVDNNHWVVRDLFDTEETRTSKERTKIVIEGTIDGKPVTEIQNKEWLPSADSDNDDEFEYETNEYVSEIVLPNTIKEICHHAFTGFEALEGIDIPDSVEKIGQQPFIGCKSIKEITIPVLNSKAFGMNDCTSLEKVTFKGKPASIGSFAYCTSLKTISIPSTVTKLGSFRNSGLEEIEIPNNIKLNSKCFFECKNLKKVVFTGKKTADKYTISKYAFANCEKLETVKLPKAKKYVIDSYSFSNTGIKSLSSKNVVKIGNYAFANCKKLKKFTIPTTIKNSAGALGRAIFENSPKLERLIIKSTAEKPYYDNYLLRYQGLNESCTVFVKNAKMKKIVKKQGVKGKVVLIPQVKNPKKLSAKGIKKGVKLSWNKVKGATGYVVYRYDSGKKQYVKVKTVKGKRAATIKNLKANKKYKFAVRAYKVKENTRFYSKYSKTKSVNVK